MTTSTLTSQTITLHELIQWCYEEWTKEQEKTRDDR